MASLIECPHCGTRPTEEFTVRGEDPGKRPASDAELSTWVEHIHFRANPRGRLREHWHHLGGCRRWLVVERDTSTHQVYGVFDVRDDHSA
ncbi:MAG: sarcosine oxidase subunit delta [Burkholderiaceae bacterium]